MPRVNIKTFTGEEENQDPTAWKTLWTDVKSAYNRVVMFYGCDFTTSNGQNLEQHWQAMTAFIHDNTVVGLLLISENSLLDQLWQRCNPKNFKVHDLLLEGDNPTLKKEISLAKYIQTYGIDIATQDLRKKPRCSLNTGLQFCLTDADIEIFLLDGIKMCLQNPNMRFCVLPPERLHRFSGKPDEYEPNREHLFFCCCFIGDFSMARTYHAQQPTRPTIWHELWTQVPACIITGSSDFWYSYYNRVITLNCCDFVTVEQDGTKANWAGAVIFMQDRQINDVLLVNTVQNMVGLYTAHHPQRFEFVAFPETKRTSHVRPLSSYLDGSLTGTPVEMRAFNVRNTPIYGTCIQMHPAGINAFGATLTTYLEGALGVN